MSKDVSNRLEGLKGKHSALSKQLIQSETRIESLNEKRDELLSRMKEEYGVDNIDDLRKLYETKQAEDSQQIDAFEAALNKAEASLKEIDQDQE